MSRAMRNRGVELFLLPESPAVPPHPLATRPTDAGPWPAVNSAAALLAALALEGVPGWELPAAMTAAHLALGAATAAMHRRSCGLRELRHWASLTRALVEQGCQPQEALAASWEQVHQFANQLPLVCCVGQPHAWIHHQASPQCWCCMPVATWTDTFLALTS